jgi:hypothetical protein
MSENTARQLMREESFPVTMVAGSPMSTSELLAEWVEARTKVAELQGAAPKKKREK